MIPLPVQIIAALLVDVLLGDPAGWPHPVRWMGRWAAWFERRVRFRMHKDRLAGVAGTAALVALTGLGVTLLLKGLGYIHPWLQDLAAIILLWTAFAAKDLAVHSRRVAAALADGDISAARRAVAMLVGRETAELNAEEVSRACVESVAENSVDGVVAPLFFAFLGGPAGALMYKAVNTLDSMWGYRTGGYVDFGWAAARLDDIVNWVPARLGGLALLGAGGLLGYPARGGWRIFVRDRGKHPSPNGGQVESAMAGLLRVQLGGENRYHGQVSSRPTLGDPVQPVRPQHILEANRLAGVAVLLVAGGMFLATSWL